MLRTFNLFDGCLFTANIKNIWLKVPAILFILIGNTVHSCDYSSIWAGEIHIVILVAISSVIILSIALFRPSAVSEASWGKIVPISTFKGPSSVFIDVGMLAKGKRLNESNKSWRKVHKVQNDNIVSKVFDK